MINWNELSESMRYELADMGLTYLETIPCTKQQ